jgi:hypothetical protein
MWGDIEIDAESAAPRACPAEHCRPGRRRHRPTRFVQPEDHRLSRPRDEPPPLGRAEHIEANRSDLAGTVDKTNRVAGWAFTNDDRTGIDIAEIGERIGALDRHKVGEAMQKPRW